MLKTVIKRDGREEPVDYSKPAKWAKWAGPDLDWGAICLDMLQHCPEEKLSTEQIQKRLIDELVSRNDHDCMLMAGRLYMGPLQRKILGKEKKKLITQVAEMMAVGQMATMSYSKEDYEYFDSLIHHERDFTYDYTQVLQIVQKYSLKDRANKSKVPLETPQFTFMRMAMALSEYYPTDIRGHHVAEFYDLFSNSILSAPTPNYNNLGTHHRGLASCCLYRSTDTTESIAAGKHIAFIMTAMSAGLGELCETRSLGDGVANNTVVAIGKVPHYRGLVGDCSELTKGGRGGSATAYYTCFDPEAGDIVMLQNPLLPHDKAVRDIHYAMELNKFFIKRALNNQDVYTFNIKTAPKVHKAFFGGSPEEFERIYFEHETKVGKSKLNYISARKLLTRLAVQFYEAGTNYSADMDEINRHTPYKEPIHQSNLCTEVTQPTLPYESVADLYLEEDHGRGEVSLCSLGAIVVPAIIKRAKEMGGDFKEAYAKIYAKATEYALRMIDYCIEYADYALPHVGFTAKKRRNAGVGVIGAATIMAMEGKKYSTMEGVKLLHDMAEDHAYHCIRASIKLGKEMGNAPWIHKTKWPEGWTPLKTYNRNVDELVPPLQRYDWDQVSLDLIECGGGRFSALITHQPTESSSKATGYPRGWYPVTALHQALGDADNIIPWCAYGNARLPYEIAWNVSMDYQTYGYAVIQKWTDQATSADYHADRSVTLELKVSALLREIALASKFGVKTRYYTKSLTVDESGEQHVTEVIDNCVGGCKV